MIAGVAFFEVVLALHIIAVVIAFGATFAYPVMLGTVSARRPARAARPVSRDPRDQPAHHQPRGWGRSSSSASTSPPSCTCGARSSCSGAWPSSSSSAPSRAPISARARSASWRSPKRTSRPRARRRGHAERRAPGARAQRRRGRRADGPARAADDLLHGHAHRRLEAFVLTIPPAPCIQQPIRAKVDNTATEVTRRPRRIPLHTARLEMS